MFIMEKYTFFCGSVVSVVFVVDETA